MGITFFKGQSWVPIYQPVAVPVVVPLPTLLGRRAGPHDKKHGSAAAAPKLTSLPWIKREQPAHAERPSSTMPESAPPQIEASKVQCPDTEGCRRAFSGLADQVPDQHSVRPRRRTLTLGDDGTAKASKPR